MNIFVTSTHPVACALALDDRRLVKMVLETTQILCTAAHFGRICTDNALPLYKPCFYNHPVTVWARATPANVHWTTRHLDALCNEFYGRFGKHHACRVYSTLFNHKVPEAPEPEVFCDCSMFKEEPIVTNAYRRTMRAKWAADLDVSRAARWTNRQPPTWAKEWP